MELFRFGWKFTPFSPSEYIFPVTRAITFLTKNTGNYRIQSLDRRIMPPNFSVIYKLSDVSGYDPLYLKSYNQLVGAWERGKPDISPSSFNRIVTPVNYSSFITNLMGVKYLLNYGPLNDSQYKTLPVFSEGNTYIYENKNVIPRVFLAENTLNVKTDQEAIDQMFKFGNNLRKIGIILNGPDIKQTSLIDSENVRIEYYSDNRVTIRVMTNSPRMVILTDVYYPNWKVTIDGVRSEIYKADYIFRGVLVPSGEHMIEFKTSFL